MIAFGDHAGTRVRRACGADARPRRSRAGYEGFNLHASAPVQAHDRAGLERLIRYTARPPLSDERLALRPDGSVALQLLRPWSDGTTEIIFSGARLIEKLAALVPRPGVNQIRYHGYLAPAAPWRHEIVPAAQLAQTDASPSPLDPDYDPACQFPPDPRATGASRWIAWSILMLRVFGLDVLECEKCGGRMRPIAYLTDPPVVTAILDHLGLPSCPPAIAPAAQQLELYLD